MFGAGYAKRTRGLFDPHSDEPYRLSRTRVDNFLRCKRCFWLEERCGVKKPDTPPFSLNNAVDELLKREFDIHRAGGTKHPLFDQYGIDVVPLKDPRMEEWRDALRRGVQALHEPTNLIIRGGVDDIWKDTKTGECIVVDYKATSKKSEINLDADWQIGYKRQMEIYQWLLRRNGCKVSDTCYFVYVNGRSDAKAFDGKLEFDVHLLPYTGDDSWIEPVISEIRDCLMNDAVPDRADECEYCGYREAAGKELMARMPKKKTPTKAAPKRATLGI